MNILKGGCSSFQVETYHSRSENLFSMLKTSTNKIFSKAITSYESVFTISIKPVARK